MKNRAILLLLGLMISSSFVFGQVSKDTLQKDSVYPRFSDSFTAEESWQIHKEAYRKQLEASGLSVDEINKKMQEYEKQKEEFIVRAGEQRKLAAEQRKLAEVQRQEAEKQRQEARAQRERADEQRKSAEIQRQEAEKQRQEARAQRERADEQRKSAEIQRQEAAAEREEAEAQRKAAGEQRKIAEEWRNNVHKLLNEHFTISGKDSETKVVKIIVTDNGPLFFNINGDIDSGNVLMEIFNPNGESRGELSLEQYKGSASRTESGFSGTSGSLNKTINEPETGEWTVKITPEKSNGNIYILVAQYVKPTIDE